MRTVLTAVALALLTTEACAQQKPAPADTTGYVRIVGDTITVIRPPGVPKLGTEHMPDYTHVVLLADTLVLVMRGDSGVSISPVAGMPIRRTTVEGLLAAAKLEKSQPVTPIIKP